MKISKIALFKVTFVFIVFISMLININIASADGKLPTNKRILEIVKSHMFTEAKPGSQMLGLGSHVTGEKYKDPLLGGTSDHDFRFIPSQGSSNQEAFEEWVKAKNKITSAIREEFGDQADDVLKTINIYPPNQLMEGVDSLEDAKDVFNNVYKTKPNLGGGPVEGNFSKGSKGFVQQYEVKKGVLIYQDPVTGKTYTKTGEAIEFQHLIEGKATHTASDFADAADDFAKLIRDDIHAKDLRSMQKHLERIDEYLARGKQRVSGYHDDYIKNLIKKVENAEELTDDLLKEVNQALRNVQFDTLLLKRMNDLKVTKAVPLLTRWQKLRSSAIEIMDQVPLDRFISCVFTALDIYMSAEMMESGNDEGAYRNLLAAGVSFVGFPPAILANMTNIIIDEMKVSGYSFVNSFQDCEDLLAGICQSTTEQKLEKTMDDIIYKDQPVTSKDFREAVGPSLQTNARDCVHKGFGPANDKSDDVKETDLFDRCLADLYNKWKRRRLEIMGQVAEANVLFVKWLQGQIITLESTPEPVIITRKDGEFEETKATIKANIRLDQNQGAEIFKRMRDPIRVLGGKKHVASVEARINYIWTVNGQQFHEDKDFYMGSGNFFDPEMLTVELPIKKDGTYDVGLKTVIEVKYTSLIVSSDERYIPKGFDKFASDVYGTVSGAVNSITGYGKKTQEQDPNAKYYGDDVVSQGRDLFNLDQTVETYSSIKVNVKTNEKIEGSITIEGPDQLIKGEESKLIAKLSPELDKRKDVYVDWFIDEIKTNADWTGKEIIVYAPKDKDSIKYIVQVTTQSKDQISNITAIVSGIGKDKSKTGKEVNPVIAETSKTIKLVDKSLKAEIEQAYKNKNYKKLIELLRQCEKADEKTLIQGYLKKLADEKYLVVKKYLDAMTAYQTAELAAYDNFYAKANAERKKYIDSKNREAESKIAQCMNDAYNKNRKQKDFIESDINHLKRVSEDYKSYQIDYPTESFFESLDNVQLGLNFDPSKPLKATDYQLFCSDKKAVEDDKKLNVIIKTTKTSVKTGEVVPVLVKVQYPPNSIMCPDEQDYIWQGNHAGSGDRVDFMATKSGSYTLSVTVKCMDNVIGSASKTFKVSGGGISGKIVGLEDNQVYYGTKKEIKLKTDLIEVPKDNNCSDNPNNPFCVDTIHSGSIKQVSGADTSPSSVYIPDPSKEFNEPIDSKYKVLWQSNRGLTFLPQDIKGEGYSNFNTKVVFDRLENPTLVWAEIYEYKDGSYETIGESDQVEIEVVAPQFVVKFDPTQDKAKIGKDVKVDIIANPTVDEKYIDYRWVEPTDRLELEHGRISFKPKHGKPINFHVIARVPHHGDVIDDEIKDQYTAGENIVVAKLIGPKFDKSSKEWSESQKGLVDVKRRLVTGQQIEASVTTEGVDADKVNYKWTSNEGCHIDSVDISDTVTVSRSEPGSCELTVVAYDKDKNRLGQDILTFGISQQDSGPVKDDKDKDKADKDKADKDKTDKDKEDKDKADKDKADKDKADKDKADKDKADKEDKVNAVKDNIEKSITSGDFESVEQAIESLSNTYPNDPIVAELKDKLSKAKDTYKDKKIIEAQTAINKGDLEQAETILNEANTNLPEEPEIASTLNNVKTNITKIKDLKDKFNEAINSGNYAEAEDIVKEMSAISRNNPATTESSNQLSMAANKGRSELTTKLNKAEALVYAGDLNQAIIELEQILPEAKNYKNNQPFVSATDKLLRETKNKKSICDSAITEAKRLIAEGKYDEAERILNNAKLASRTYKPLVELSNSLHEIKTNFNEKLKDLINRAYQEVNVCNYDQAIELINQAKALTPDDDEMGRKVYDINNRNTIFIQDLDRSKLYLDRGDIDFAKQELAKHESYCASNDKFIAAKKRIDDYYAGKNSEIVSKIAEIRALLDAKEYTKTVSLAKETRTTLHPTGENAIQISDMESAALKKLNEQKGAINYINIVQTHLNQYNYQGCLSQLGVLDNQYPDCWEPSSEEPARIAKLRSECQTKSNRLNEILPIVKNAALNSNVSMYDLGKANVLSDELVSLNPNQYDYGKYRTLIKQKMAKVSSASTSSQGGDKTSIYDQWKNKKNGQSWGQTSTTPPDKTVPTNQGQSWGQTASTQPDRTPQTNNNFKDKQLYDNGNIGGCSYTNTGTFTINRSLNVSILEAYYHWKQGQTTEKFTLYKNGTALGAGHFTKNECSPGTSWCRGLNNLNKILSPGQYTVKTADSRICQNSGTGGNGVIRIYSKDPKASSSDIAGSTKNVKPTITGSTSINSNLISGVWDMVANTHYKFDLNISVNNNVISGTMTRTNGSEPVDQLKGNVLSNGTFKFQRIRAGSWVQNYTGRVVGGKLTGNFDQGGQGNYGWYASRKSANVSSVTTVPPSQPNVSSSSGFDGKYSGTCRIYSGSGTCNVSMTVSNNQVSGSIIGIIEGDNVNASFTGAVIMPGVQYSQKSASIKATITKGTIMDHTNNRMERFTGSFSGTIYSSSKANGNLNFIITGQGNGPEGEWHVTRSGQTTSKPAITPTTSTSKTSNLAPRVIFINKSAMPVHFYGKNESCSPGNKVNPGQKHLRALMTNYSSGSARTFYAGRNGSTVAKVDVPISYISQKGQTVYVIYDSSGRLNWSK